MSSNVTAIVITGYGLNCEKETAQGLQHCGATARIVHVADLLRRPSMLHEAHLLACIGGFSFGDHLGAGAVLANRMKFRLRDDLLSFIHEGRLVLGICNGFQTIARLGLVPGFAMERLTPDVAMAHNDSGVFHDGWVTLRCNSASPCVFTKGLDQLQLPVRHGEGKFVARSRALLEELQRKNLVAMRYVDPRTGQATTEFPYNPNGSVDGIAGVCDETGRVFGMMPHPEAFLSPFNDPQWPRKRLHGVLSSDGAGAQIFRNAVEFIRGNLL